MSIGARLKEERGRLKYSRAKLSERTGISAYMIGRYEKNEDIPNRHTLGHFAGARLDVQYIMTDTRCEYALPHEERTLLEFYRKLEKNDQEELIAFAFREDEQKILSLYKKANKAIKHEVMTILNTGVRAGLTVSINGNRTNVNIR